MQCHGIQVEIHRQRDTDAVTLALDETRAARLQAHLQSMVGTRLATDPR